MNERSLKKIREQRIVSDPSMFVRMAKVRTTFWKFISSLNLFQTRVANDDDLIHQRWTTRAFILLMVVAVIVSVV